MTDWHLSADLPPQKFEQPTSRHAACTRSDDMSLLADGQKRPYAPTPFDQAGGSSKQSKPSPGGGGLNQQQQHALELALSGVSIFLTGGAGTGKSFSMPHRARTPPSRLKIDLPLTRASPALDSSAAHHQCAARAVWRGRRDDHRIDRHRRLPHRRDDRALLRRRRSRQGEAERARGQGEEEPRLLAPMAGVPRAGRRRGPHPSPFPSPLPSP